MEMPPAIQIYMLTLLSDETTVAHHVNKSANTLPIQLLF